MSLSLNEPRSFFFFFSLSENMCIFVVHTHKSTEGTDEDTIQYHHWIYILTHRPQTNIDLVRSESNQTEEGSVSGRKGGGGGGEYSSVPPTHLPGLLLIIAFVSSSHAFTAIQPNEIQLVRFHFIKLAAPTRATWRMTAFVFSRERWCPKVSPDLKSHIEGIHAFILFIYELSSPNLCRRYDDAMCVAFLLLS